VLAKVFPPELVDRVVDEAGVRERRARALPGRVVVYYVLAMVLFFRSGYAEVWNKLVAGLDWARQFQGRLAVGMQPTPAAITLARQRLGWRVMEALLEIYAMLCCYQAIRVLISDAAADAGIDPRRVSFTAVRDAVRRRISDPGSFSPQELDEALADLAFEIAFSRNLVPGRPGRRYVRQTKRSGGRYKTRKHGQSKPTHAAHRDQVLALHA